MEGKIKLMLTEEQISRWQTLRDQMLQDQNFVNRWNEIFTRRQIAVKQMRDVLVRYQSGKLDNAELRLIFQKKTAKEWVTFGLNAFSGAMFLNMLVKNVPEQSGLEKELKAVLTLPSTPEDGTKRLNRFMEYLRDLQNRGLVAKKKVQPTSAPFFVSAWWHMQNVEEYPIYYKTSWAALEAEGVYKRTDMLVRNYFNFRKVFLEIANVLEFNIWQMESLCLWREQGDTEITSPVEEIMNVPPTDGTEIKTPKADDQSHTHIQLLLAQIGQKLGYNVWIASNDRSRQWNKQILGQYSIKELPHLNGVGKKSQRMIELIDVVWLKGSNRIIAAFEVESTTSIFSGLLRMSDLTIALENFNFPLYIAVPEVRIDEVKAQLSRLTFQRLELNNRCAFFPFEKLIEEADAIMRYAQDHTAINAISQRVDNVDQSEY